MGRSGMSTSEFHQLYQGAAISMKQHPSGLGATKEDAWPHHERELSGPLVTLRCSRLHLITCIPANMQQVRIPSIPSDDALEQGQRNQLRKLLFLISTGLLSITLAAACFLLPRRCQAQRPACTHAETLAAAACVHAPWMHPY